MMLSKKIAPILLAGTFFQLAIGQNVFSQPQEVGFSERFALAESRESALSELIPGTEVYFYYHCLHFQTSGKIAESRGQLDSWIAKFGLNDQNRRMQARQTLLEYSKNPQATLQYLTNEFGGNVFHPAPRKDEAAELETKLDPNVLAWSNILKSHSHDLNSIELNAWSHGKPYLTDNDKLRGWLQRMQRSEDPDLVALIAKELKLADSRGFGVFGIHNALTQTQLIELQKQLPQLRESNAYVQARLRRIRPSDDSSLEDDNVLRAHLTQLEAFTESLPESQSSLKAQVLFHRLRLDERSGNMNRERFLRFLALPCNRSISNPAFLAKQNGKVMVDLNANSQAETLLPPIVDDSKLIERYLESFFQADANIDAFTAYLDRDYLSRVFASTKILYGIGDAKIHYSKLSEDAQRQLQSRIELNYAPNNVQVFKPTDTVKLIVDLKNTPEVLVKIYRVNARNVLKFQKQAINTSLDLDGLMANQERRLTYALPADRRHRETIELPELEGGGVWVVDLLSGGLRSRALIHKGQLHATQNASSLGILFRVFDSLGRHAPSAKAILGEREFSAGEDGNILIPHAQTSKIESLILVDGAVASVQQFEHSAENYSLTAGFLIDPQSLLAGGTAKMVIRPNLMCNGNLVSLEHFEKPKLTVVSTDLDGVSATQTFTGFQISDSIELIKSFSVPQRLASLDISLEGQVLTLSNNTRFSIAATHSMAINQTAKSAATHDFYLSQSADGYQLEVRGRNGEPLSRVPVQLDFKLLGLGPTASVRLATDDSGKIGLGKLVDVERFTASADKVAARPFDLSRHGATWPAHVHVAKGEPIELDRTESSDAEPITFLGSPTKTEPGRYELIEYRSGTPFESHSSKIVLNPGQLSVAGLEPGTYRLSDYLLGRTTQIYVVDGVVDGESIVGQHRILETNRVRPVFISDLNVSPDKIEIKIGNNDPSTRVHVIANAFRPYTHQAQVLSAPGLPVSVSNLVKIPSYYINSLRLDEEYQYVIQRQLTPKHLGSLLPQPSAILNPWELSVTQNSTQQAAAGEAMPSNAPAPGMIEDLSRPAKSASIASATVLPDYEFLKKGSLILTNGRCNAEGVLQVDRKSLLGLTSVTVIAVHPSGTTYRTLALPSEGPIALTDRRLVKPFAATDRLTEVQQVQILLAGKKHTLGDAGATRVRLYSSIAETFQLYRTLLQDSSMLAKLECIEQWSTLKDEEKVVRYSDLACHELHLFLLNHDRPFFDKVVRPFLANKMQKQFMDDYVLGNDLSKYAKPWQFERMNVVERVLLAKKLASQSGATRKWLTDVVEANPLDSTAGSARFLAALMSVAIGQDASKMDRKELALNSLNESNLNGRLHDSPADVLMFDSASIPLGEMEVEEERSAGKKQKANASRAFGGRGAARARVQLGRLFEGIESTRKWAESNYFRLPIANQNAALVKPHAFWLDYLAHDENTPFLSTHLDLASTNVHEAILAMAVLGLPLNTKSPELEVVDGKIVIEATGDSIAFIQGIKSIEPMTEPSILLATQNIYFADEAGQAAKPVQGKPLIRGTVYRQRLVLTNPSDANVRVTVLQQIPAGAIALENAKTVSGRKVDLAPFATQEVTTKFYFPEAGSFSHFGSQMAQVEQASEKLAIAIPSYELKVLDKPDSVDESSWPYVASWGTEAQVLEYLAKANLANTNLDLIAWRLADRKFYDACLKQLTDSGAFRSGLWAYALKHNDPSRIQEFLEANPAVLQRVGSPFRSELLQVDPVQRLTLEHLDFRPLIVARAHLLGTKRVILNDAFAQQYAVFIDALAQQASIEPEQRLAIVYYLLLQNRISEAIEQFAKINSADHNCKLQHDYFAAYLNMLQGKFEEANQIAESYTESSNIRWQDLFAQVRQHVAERKALQAGKTLAIAKGEDWKTDPANRILNGGRNQQNAEDSELAPVLDLTREGDAIRVQHRNLSEIEINYYVMDVELLFSRNPFSQQESSRLNTIEPNWSEKKSLGEGMELGSFDLVVPEKLRNKNVGIEITAGGLIRRLDWYTNSLAVNIAPSTGRLQVLKKQGMQPLEGAYVKVYSRDQSDSSVFFKDGYTDLRGVFDYATLSTNDLSRSKRLAILVIHPEFGTVVREVEPPK